MIGYPEPAERWRGYFVCLPQQSECSPFFRYPLNPPATSSHPSVTADCFGLAQGETTYDDLAKRLGRRLLSRRGHSQRLQYAGCRKRVGIITGDKTNNFIN
jgi:hypothetical protein